jgi:arylsulfatase A-like enzyme
MRTLRLALAVVVAAVALLLFLRAPGRVTPSPTPSVPPVKSGSGINLLLITIDTLRADHLGAYGYGKPTSPRLDALAQQGALFEKAYTYWPKTRGSFVMMMTGRRPSQNGYSKTHPGITGFNPTLASVLKEAGYATSATVDNPNVAAQHGYAKGFDHYRETWQEKKSLLTEMDRTRAITGDGVAYLRDARADRPFFLWLHYVNPHAPYTPPAPNDTAFLDGTEGRSPRLAVVTGFHGGIKKDWAVPGQDRLGWYVAQYDGEIATVDAEVGKLLDALQASAVKGNTLVVVTSDHGESLGEHDYYFDHGEDVFEPSLRIPLIVAGPGVKASTRSSELTNTLDLVPTVLDVLKVSYPPDLAGRSLARALEGRGGQGPARLFAQNDRGLTATWDERSKLVAKPRDDGGAEFELWDRTRPPVDLVRAESPDDVRAHRREIEVFIQRQDREWVRTKQQLTGVTHQNKMTPEACADLEALGYVDAACPSK